jgi:hypothetical protein
MFMDLPVYKLRIEPEIEGKAEVTAVALVDFPAIQEDFQYFKKHPQKYSIQSEDQRIISGPLMIADKPIYRENDEYGPHYIVFDAATIRQIMIKYAKKKYQSNVNEMHQTFLPNVTLFESFITDSERGIKPMAGYEDAPNGSWVDSSAGPVMTSWPDGIVANLWSNVSLSRATGIAPLSMPARYAL